MESLSRPPHRRKHSKNPYDDVSLSNGVSRESLDAHEYAEIFSGSSSIPVLDLSGLDERVGSGDFRSSKLDYTNIFGGFGNDDVAVPYEELFNGSAKKTKPRNPKKSHSPPQESDSSHSSEKPKMPSDEASDLSADIAKKQFNLSFNKTNQRNTDPSNGKTHIAQLHAVPGFTYFVDGASRPQAATGNDKPVNSLKRDVSRTWSFSAEVKDGLNHQKSHTTPDKSQSRPPPNFTPKKEAPEKIIGEGSPPYYGEDFDENSVAAASAAALKKAIDQAQESIRLAKMIMDRKKEGYQNKSRQRSSKKEKSKAKYEEIDPTFTVFNGVDGKFSPSSKENEVFINAAKTEVTKVCEYIGVAKEHGTAISGGDEFFSLTGSRSESACNDKKKESEKIAENVVSEETRSGGAGFPVLSDNVGKTGNLENLEQREKTVFHAKGPEVESELVGRVLDTSQSIQELEKNVEKAENKVERVINTPQRARRQWNVSAEAGKNLGVGCHVDVGTEERENDVDGKGKQELEEMLNVEHFTELRSGFDNFMNASCNVGEIETLGQVETENGYIWKTHDDETNLWFESEEELKEAFPEIEMGEKRVDETHESEIDNQKQNHPHDVDEPKLREEHEQNKVEAVPEITEVGANNRAEIQKSRVFYDSEETNDILGGSGKIEENPDKCQYEEHIDEAVDVNSSCASTITSETREACNIDLDNKPDECERVVEKDKDNDNVPEVMETFSAIDKDREDDIEVSGIETLRRIASEEIFVESKLHNIFDSLSSDETKMENVGAMDADRDEELPEDEDASNATSEIHDVAPEFTSKINLRNSVDASDIRTVEFDAADVYEQTSESDEGSVSTSSHEYTSGLSAHEPEDFPENGSGLTSNNEEQKDEPEPVSNERLVEEQSEPKEKEIGFKTENNKENLQKLDKEPENNKENLQKLDKDDYHQRIEAIKKGREREKDRIVVERAIREARERAFAEARERAERAAVEKAAAEARKRAMAEAREKVDKANKEAKLRAERAAVERATTEARGRALEKAMSQKTTDAEGRTPEKVSGPSRNNGLKHSFSSSDLENVTESAQRRKARLERHQRIMERAAKALAEKNMRDVLAQKEQAERNRLSESLDADIKRWSTGKEKNMRALLSTLQYILGPESGWQPIPLTEIVTTAAVKKAYRKATLYVHPDKLQQRGASIRQKYICEKVFDLLKAAWSRFNSDER